MPRLLKDHFEAVEKPGEKTRFEQWRENLAIILEGYDHTDHKKLDAGLDLMLLFLKLEAELLFDGKPEPTEEKQNPFIDEIPH